MLFLEFHHLHTCYLDQSQQFLMSYHNQVIDFQALDLCGKHHFNECILFLQLVLGKICMLIFLKVFDEPRYNRRVRQSDKTPLSKKAHFQFQ